MIRFSFRYVLLPVAVATVVGFLVDSRVLAQPWQGSDGQPGGGAPVYQQHASGKDRRDERRDRRDFRRDKRFSQQQTSASWFQRPYPYHLDYYKMRYGGSYAPYFGNLYGTPFGTPQVVNYPPYYGPYYGGNGGGFANGYGMPGNGGVPMEYPTNPAVMMPGAVEESLTGQSKVVEPPAKASGEALPAPTPTP